MPRGGLKKFLKAKGASERVRTMCQVHNANLAEKWWRYMKIMPENWRQFSKDRDSVPMRMMYDLREVRSGEMTMLIEWYWWVMPLTSMTMKSNRNQKTVVCHGVWKGEPSASSEQRGALPLICLYTT